MNMALIALFCSFFLFLVIFLPISFCIGLSAVAALLVEGDITLQIVPQRIFTALDSFTLLSIPFFILVGDVMVEGGIARRLIALTNGAVGSKKGGVAYVTIIASVFFGAISGSAIATTSAIGGLMYPEMVKKNYNKSFAAAVGAASGTLGILIPPSIAFIVFGTQTGTSVTALFLCGGVAGILVAILYMIASKAELSDKDVIVDKEEQDKASKMRALKDASWGLLAPVIILGGIYSGKFTATESAVIAVAYCVVIGFFVYKELTVANLIKITVKSAVSSAAILLLIGTAQLFSWVLTIENVGSMLEQFLLNSGLDTVMFLLIVNLIYIVLGMLMETLPIIILTAPILFPIAAALGVSPVHFGVMTVVNLAFGLFTPPFGTCLFMSNSYSRQPVVDICAKAKYFYIFGLAGIMLVTYFPGIYLWIAR